LLLKINKLISVVLLLAYMSVHAIIPMGMMPSSKEGSWLELCHSLADNRLILDSLKPLQNSSHSHHIDLPSVANHDGQSVHMAYDSNIKCDFLGLSQIGFFAGLSYHDLSYNLVQYYSANYGFELTENTSYLLPQPRAPPSLF